MKLERRRRSQQRFLFVSALFFLRGCQCLSSSSNSPNRSSAAAETCRPADKNHNLSSALDANEIRHTIRSGRVYARRNFLSEPQIRFLTQDIQRLQQEGNFERSGLSNTIKGKSEQGFGQQDRSVCPVPWWKDSLLQSSTATVADGGGDAVLSDANPVAAPLNDLRHFLSETLNRPTMRDATLQHECYYSVSGPGSTLSRHMDERHEELKGPKGWLLHSRRSLSWLIYLSDESDWTLEKNGGALRTFPQQQLRVSVESLQKRDTSTQNGNLAIGYLHDHAGNSVPVYLDGWYLPTGAVAGDYHHVLYTINNSGTETPQYITHPWRPERLPPGMSLADFLIAFAERDADSSQPSLFLRSSDAQQFILLEDRAAWDSDQAPPAGSETVDICPSRGTLVVFDSVMLPHQVEAVKQGNRIALAGWFHEQTQGIPT